MQKQGGKTRLILAIITLLLLPSAVKGGLFAQASEPGVLISEICWMGSEDSSSDEWIELYNSSGRNISLDGWLILAQDGQPEIALEGIIPARGYFLLERTDDDSAPKATADLVYSGSLANSGEDLDLFDDDDDLMDEIKASEGWPAGDNETKETMQLVAGNWTTAEGTPKKDNHGSSIAKDELTEDTLEDSDDNGSTYPEVSADKKGKIIINEIYPNVVGSDRTGEFIELMNIGQATVDLEGWRIEVDEKTYEFGRLDILYETQFGKTVGPGKQFAIFRPQSRLILNNSGGEIKLFKPSGKTAEDTLEYPPAPEGYSYVNTKHIDLERISTSTKEFFLNSPLVGDWVFSAQISPGANNQVKALNTAPKAYFSAPRETEPKKEIFFDASDTLDKEGDDMEFSWDFGDGVEIEMEEARHTFLDPGEYEVVLEVSDGRDLSVFSRVIEVLGQAEPESAAGTPENNDGYWFEDIEEPLYQPFSTEEPLTGERAVLSVRQARSELGRKAETEGVVLVEPGILGTQYFYIADQEAGIRVYNYKKDFPSLEPGDLIRARGEIVEIRDETTLKTSVRGDMEVISGRNELPIKEASSEEMIRENSGQLLAIEGRIAKKDLPRIYINDGLGEAVVYIKPGIDADTGKMEEDKEVEIKGILATVSGDLVILPRQGSDITVKEETAEPDSGRVLGEQGIEEWQLPERNDKKGLLKYVLAVIIAGIVIAFLIFRHGGKTVF